MSGYCGRRQHVSAEFLGMTTEQIQAALARAQASYADLMNSDKISAASYSQGDGSKSITNQNVTPTDLLAYIERATMALGMHTRRRAIRPGF